MLNWLPKNVSTFGGDVDSVIALIYYVVGAWFVLTYGVIIALLIRYRRRPGRRAIYAAGKRSYAALGYRYVRPFVCPYS
jgi:hypothetical protein